MVSFSSYYLILSMITLFTFVIAAPIPPNGAPVMLMGRQSNTADVSDIFGGSQSDNESSNVSSENASDNSGSVNKQAFDRAQGQIESGIRSASFSILDVAFLSNQTQNTEALKFVGEGLLALGAASQPIVKIADAVSSNKEPNVQDQKDLVVAIQEAQQAFECVAAANNNKDKKLQASIKVTNNSISNMASGVAGILDARNIKLSDLGLDDQALSSASQENCNGGSSQNQNSETQNSQNQNSGNQQSETQNSESNSNSEEEDLGESDEESNESNDNTPEASNNLKESNEEGGSEDDREFLFKDDL